MHCKNISEEKPQQRDEIEIIAICKAINQGLLWLL
jgi:hypothetical protein